MEHNSAKIAKELGFSYKYVLEEFYRNHRDVERKARRICEDNSEKTIEELKVLVKDYNIAGIKEETVAKRNFENDQARIKKQQFYEQFSMNSALKRKAEEEQEVKVVKVLVKSPTRSPTRSPPPTTTDSSGTMVKPIEIPTQPKCIDCKQKEDKLEQIEKELAETLTKLAKAEEKLVEADERMMVLDKENLVHVTEIKCLKREAELFNKEREVWKAEKLKLQIDIDREKRYNQKLSNENMLLKQSLASPYFQQQKKIN